MIRRWSGVVLVLGLAVAVAGGAALLARPGAQNSAEPLDDSDVVATLQTDGPPRSGALRALLRETRMNPGDRALAQRTARTLLQEGRAAGDSRLVGAALGVLRPFLGAPDAETLVIAAMARQYQHDFPGALMLLDQAVGMVPHAVDALLNRAILHIVQGRYPRAAQDCRALSGLQQPQIGFLCLATAQVLTAQAPEVYRRLGAMLTQPGLLDPALWGWAVGLMGEIAMAQGDTARAKQHFAQVITADPAALRERLILADLLLATGTPHEVPDLLNGAPEVDGVLIRRALAARALGDAATAEAAGAELAQRFRQNLDLGLTAHAREETRYFLEIAPDPAMALARARVNWALQHEIEDAQLLIDAAVAAGEPEAARPVLDWMAAQSVSVPTLRLPDAVPGPAP